jgi:hypothetical protein
MNKAGNRVHLSDNQPARVALAPLPLTAPTMHRENDILMWPPSIALPFRASDSGQIAAMG